MLIFSKDISKRDHAHCREREDPELKEYMEYQRKLFPYTIARAGLDLAYKELDDILNYIDAGNEPPPGSMRQEYPEDVSAWYQTRFPWTAVFAPMEDMHNFLVGMIKCMDSFRTHETCDAWRLMVAYDAVHNIVNVYNGLLKTAPENARDLRLSAEVEVDFEDFINNYWPNLHFMILSKPDYPHTRLNEMNRKIEAAIQQRTLPGDSPIAALEEIAGSFDIDQSVLTLLRHDAADSLTLAPLANADGAQVYAKLYETIPEGSPFAGIPVIDAEYEMNLRAISRPLQTEADQRHKPYAP